MIKSANSPAHRVFVDFNEGNETVGFSLHLNQSKKDLEKMGSSLIEGARVIIYMPEELEMEAILTFNAAYDAWIALPIVGTETYFDKK